MWNQGVYGERGTQPVLLAILPGASSPCRPPQSQSLPRRGAGILSRVGSVRKTPTENFGEGGYEDLLLFRPSSDKGRCRRAAAIEGAKGGA